MKRFEIRRLAGPIIFTIVVLLFGALLSWMLYIDAVQTAAPTSRIAVVVYGGDNADRWKSLEQGIRQACIELGIEKPVLTMVRADDPQRQAVILQREAEEADGLLVAAAEMDAVGPVLAELGDSIKTVFIESGVGESYPLVAADNRRMGRELANRVLADGQTVAVLAENLSRQSVAERHAGFVERMEELGRDVQVLQRGPDSDLRAFIASSLARPEGPEVLVVLDNDTLEVAIDAAPAAMVEGVRICGVGSSSKVVHALDTGVVDEIVFTNEYAIGYLGTLRLAAEMGLARAPVEAEIQYSLVRRQNMYDPETERLLFPIVQ